MSVMFKSWFEDATKATYYDSIYDLPIYNWFKIMDKNNLGFLRKESTFKSLDSVEEDTSKKAVDMWHSIVNQMTSEFGQDEAYKDIIEKKMDIAMLEVEFVITKNKRLLTDIEIKKSKLNTPEESKEFDYNKEIAIISKFQGTPIDPRKMSVYQYNNAKNQLKESANG